LGHPSKVQQLSRLCVITAPTSLTGGQRNFARCLPVSLAGILYIHFRGILPPDGRCKIHFTSVLRSPILAALLHGTPAASAKLCGVVGLHGMELRNFRRGRHLYSAGRPSRWASAHILVKLFCLYLGNCWTDLRQIHKEGQGHQGQKGNFRPFWSACVRFVW